MLRLRSFERGVAEGKTVGARESLFFCSLRVRASAGVLAPGRQAGSSGFSELLARVGKVLSRDNCRLFLRPSSLAATKRETSNLQFTRIAGEFLRPLNQSCRVNYAFRIARKAATTSFTRRTASSAAAQNGWIIRIGVRDRGEYAGRSVEGYSAEQRPRGQHLAHLVLPAIRPFGCGVVGQEGPNL